MSENNYGLAWSEEFELGYEKVDDQHRRMFELVRNLVKACTEGYDKKVLSETLDFLLLYTIQHFKDEEELMLLHDYPEYEQHKQMHEDFQNVVYDKVREYVKNGSTEELSTRVNRIVVRWLINHIQREDRKIADYLRSLEVI